MRSYSKIHLEKLLYIFFLLYLIDISYLHELPMFAVPRKLIKKKNYYYAFAFSVNISLGKTFVCTELWGKYLP